MHQKPSVGRAPPDPLEGPQRFLAGSGEEGTPGRRRGTKEEMERAKRERTEEKEGRTERREGIRFHTGTYFQLPVLRMGIRDSRRNENKVCS